MLMSTLFLTRARCCSYSNSTDRLLEKRTLMSPMRNHSVPEFYFCDQCYRVTVRVWLQSDAETLTDRMCRVSTTSLKYLPDGGLSTFEYVSEYDLVLGQCGSGILSCDKQVRDVLEGL
jgi:hypothetical protein